MPDQSAVQQLDIVVETLSVPPPYSHTYNFRLQLMPNEVQAVYALHYTDRDELGEEEIWEEGFSEDDDFHWEGVLPEVWREVLLSLWSQTQWIASEEVDETVENAILIVTTFQDGLPLEGVPEPTGEWEYLLQELTQAVYEAAQRERPLQIRYLQRSSEGEEYQLTLKVHFLNRMLTIIRQQPQKTEQYNPAWAEVKPLLTALYQLDYHSEQAYAKMPKISGQYIDPGDGLWYQLEKAVTSPGRADRLGQIVLLIGKYLDK
ncbi:MAG: hypothetical protein ACFB15_17655 [Cyclobacteriaceae bacterium]|mgnify:CR=1 FL=1